jgi:transglutaminase-like putative cysteine protease
MSSSETYFVAATTVTPGPNLYNNLYAVGAAIHATNESVVLFANNHTKTSVGTETNLTYTMDLFDYVNEHWTNATGNATPYNSSYLVSVLAGNDRDYSIAMCAIAEAFGVKSRTVEAFSGDRTIYYPEVLVASNNSDFITLQQYIGSRYGEKNAFAHSDGGEYWLSLARGSAPGLKVNATAEYSVDSSQAITRIS